ncbi:MAG: imidazolonepropionase [Saprospiraceae bacterium]|jgi:imidazolonepropionase
MIVIEHIGTLAGVRQQKGGAPLRGNDLRDLPVLNDAWLAIKNGRIHSFGSMQMPFGEDALKHDAKGGFVIPAWVDSHTHIVFAASREQEFVDRINGMSYQEIAARGGGILNSAARLRSCSEDELFLSATERLLELVSLGTGAIEIKSGYGLSAESELKMLRVIKKLSAVSPIPVRSTFLGAHALPAEFRDNRRAYVDMLVFELLPQIASEQLADYIDVFCESGFFTVDETIRLIEEGAKRGLKAKIHTNQFNMLGGIEAAVSRGALSVDHLEVLNDGEIETLAMGNTIATLLPTAPFFLRDPYQPARKLLDAGVAVALASDYNPGSSPSGNMNFVCSLACIALRMTPEEAVNAATWNGACALELQDEVGAIAPGMRANIIITRPMPDIAYLPYAFGSNQIREVWMNGQPFRATL